MSDARERARVLIDQAAQQRIDPEDFVRRFGEAARLAAFRQMGQLLGATVNDWRIDADRDRLIDQARD